VPIGETGAATRVLPGFIAYSGAELLWQGRKAMPLKEKLLIQRIRRAASKRVEHPGLGIGDDCAVLRIPAGEEVLGTTDFSLENVHFRREWHPPESVGHRCLARGLSDIAAMGGTPRAAFLSLALPVELSQKWVDQFLAGLLKLADRYRVPLAGGDTAQSPGGVLADIMVVGSVPRGKAILRSGAHAGDLLYVTGGLGTSAAALHQLRDGKKLRPQSHLRHFYPEPRIAVGQFLREKKLASAMIDISDGLSTDLGHICEESGTGAVVYANLLPIFAANHPTESLVPGHGLNRATSRSTKDRASAPAALADTGAKAQDSSAAVFGTTRSRALIQTGDSWNRLDLALHGGEEYELLFTARPNRRIPQQIAGVPVSLIGEILSGKVMTLATADGKTQPLKPAGWEHFG
jgi:thiamine-monophosphate kinase